MGAQDRDSQSEGRKVRRIGLPGISIDVSDAPKEGDQTVGELAERQVRSEQRSEAWGVVASVAGAIIGLLIGLAAVLQTSPFGGAAMSLAAAALGSGVLAAARLALETSRERGTESEQSLPPNLRSLHNELVAMRRPLLERSTPHPPRGGKS